MSDLSHLRRRVGPLLLTLSVGLNLFLAGWGLSQSLSPRAYAKPDPAPEAAAEVIAGALPRADGDLLRQAMAAQRESLRQAHSDYLAAFTRLRTVIATEPLDEAALHAAIDEMRSTRQRERVMFGDTIVGVIPRMSPKGRQAFVATHMGARQ